MLKSTSSGNLFQNHKLHWEPDLRMVDTNSLAMMDPNSRRRVKLYMLNAERMWDDRGTGYISSMYVEKFRGMCLLVRSEDDGECWPMYRCILNVSLTKYIFINETLFVNLMSPYLCLFPGTVLMESKINLHTAYQKQQVGWWQQSAYFDRYVGCNWKATLLL